MSEAAAAPYLRFTRYERAEHAFVLSMFVVLSLTGFPQKFYPSAWSSVAVNAMGGVDTVRLLHRGAGLAFSGFAVLHLMAALLRARRPQAGLSLVPNWQDVRDALGSLRHELGVSAHHPSYDRYDYRQKFEYWGMLLGGALMVGTGLVLYLPLLATRLLPGQVIPAAKAAHGNEGLMAFLVVIVWHLFHVVMEPEVFPVDRTIFTGRLSLERMEKEHPLELRRARGEALPPPGARATLANLALAPLQATAFVLFLPAAGLVVLAGQARRAWRAGRVPVAQAAEEKRSA